MGRAQISIRKSVFFSILVFDMAPKTKLKTRSSTQKRGRSAKSKKSQSPPLFPTSHKEADLGRNEDEPTLKDVMMALGSINSRLAAHDARLEEMATPEELLMSSNPG